MNAMDKAIVKDIASYKYPAPTLSRVNPRNAYLIAKASLYDPSFSAADYQTRQAVRRSFTSGKESTNIKQLNTAIAHLGNLNDATDALDNADSLPLHIPGVQLWNKIKNAVEEGSGDTRQDRFQTAATFVSSELASVMKGAGATDQEIHAVRDRINLSKTHAQMKAVIDEAVGILGGRLDAIKSRYKEGVGRAVDFDILDTTSKKVLKGIGHPLDDESMTPDTPSTPPPTAQTFTDKATGKVFKLKDGGDPNNIDDYVLAQ
jgi:hypothetical protein